MVLGEEGGLWRAVLAEGTDATADAEHEHDFRVLGAGETSAENDALGEFRAKREAGVVGVDGCLRSGRHHS